MLELNIDHSNAEAVDLRNDRWKADVRREVVRSVVDRERHTFPANLLGLLICAAAATSLPDPTIYLFPIFVRGLALASIRFTTLVLRRRLAESLPYDRQLWMVAASLWLSGLSWALLIFPIMENPIQHTASLAILGVMAVGASSICSLLGPLPVLMIAYIAGYIMTIATGLAFFPNPSSTYILFSTSAIVLGCATYGFGAGRPNIAAAEMLVENRHLGEELASALAHAEFLSQQDPLTGLMNRRAFFEGGCTNDSNLRRQILAIDLDHFKRINDSFGHDTGDKVLVDTARAMRELTRELPAGPHFAIRMGGEEFTIVLEGVDNTIATAAAEDLRLRIAEIGEGVNGLNVSCSIGVAECAPSSPLRNALRHADRALYRAKSEGRNRIISFGDS